MKFENLQQWQLFAIPNHLQDLMEVNIPIKVEKDYVLRIFDNMLHSKISNIKNLSRDVINQYYLLKALGFDDFSDYTTENYYLKKLQYYKIFYTSCAGNWGRDKKETNGKPRDLKGKLKSESYVTFKHKAETEFRNSKCNYAVIYNDDECKFFFVKKDNIDKLKCQTYEFSNFYDENDFLTLNQVLKGEIFK